MQEFAILQTLTILGNVKVKMKLDCLIWRERVYLRGLQLHLIDFLSQAYRPPFGLSLPLEGICLHLINFRI